MFKRLTKTWRVEVVFVETIEAVEAVASRARERRRVAVVGTLQAFGSIRRVRFVSALRASYSFIGAKKKKQTKEKLINTTSMTMIVSNFTN